MRTSAAIPQTFRDRFQALLGNELEAFLACLAQPPTAFLRINTLKMPVDEGLARLAALGIEAAPLPWFPEGFRVTGSHDHLSATREHSLGYFYVQEGASMIPPVALDPAPHHEVLDLCAAPGSKTTQMAQMMRNQGAIAANDYSLRRIVSLSHNLESCGVVNTLVLWQNGLHLPKVISLRFDRVLVDAPCTASGQLRSKPPKCETGDPKHLSHLQAIQKQLLTAGFRCLKPDGLLVYSTCSLHPEEDEDVVQNLLDQMPEAELVEPQVPGLVSHLGLSEWGNRQYADSMRHCRRIYPHDNDTDGFFLALVKSTDRFSEASPRRRK
jgi:NOL1/NOP2/sun family putative RNA methylase